METKDWIQLIIGLGLQISGLIVVLWQFSIRTNRRAAEHDATWRGRLDAHDEKFKSTEKIMEEVQHKVDKLEEQFNHRFTDYKNEVIDLIKELKSDKDKAFSKFDNQLTCINKKVQAIGLDLAFLKGERKTEGKGKLPSQEPKDEPEL